MMGWYGVGWDDMIDIGMDIGMMNIGGVYANSFVDDVKD